MKNKKVLVIFAVVIALVIVFKIFSANNPPIPRNLTTVIYNVRFIDSEHKSKNAIGISESKIAAIGNSDDLLKNCSDKCIKFDGKENFILPGFHDSHVHLIAGAKINDEYKILPNYDINQVVANLKTYAKNNLNKKWLLGRGWNTLNIPQQLINKKALDTVTTGKPIYLIDITGHQGWVNSAALALAKITSSTPNPEGGVIVKDASGNPTGLLLEKAKDLVSDLVPALTDAEFDNYILEGQKIAVTRGFTAMQGALNPMSTAEMYAYQRVLASGKLKQRSFIWGNLFGDNAEIEEQIEFAKKLPKDGILQITAFKGILDGVLSSSTASMLKPYLDNPSNTGLLKENQELLNAQVLKVNTAGFPALIHAIGDKAVRMALDAFENSQGILKKTFKNRVEHLSVIDPADIPRFKKLDVIASMQPPFIYYSSAQSFSKVSATLGPERLMHLYSWKTMQDSGAMLTFGSDFPAMGPNLLPDPIFMIYRAVHRQFRDGTVFDEKDAVTGEFAVKALTENPAISLGMENRLGKIAVGYEADLVLFPKNPQEASAGNLSENPLQAIFIAGQKIEL